MNTHSTPTLEAVTPATPCSAACPKCGSLDIHRHHRASKEEWSRNLGENRQNYETLWVSYEGYSAKALKECITHHCRCCQWKWESDCLPNASDQTPRTQDHE